MSADAARRASVCFVSPATQGLAQRAEEFRRGIMSTRLPYSLDGLERHGYRVETAPDGGGLARAAMTATLRLGTSYDPSRLLTRITSDAVLCWDERTGIPAALRNHRARPVLTGVIWADEKPTVINKAGLQRCAVVWALSRAQLPRLREMGIPDPQHLIFSVDESFWTPADDVAVDGARGPEDFDHDVFSVGNDRNREHATLISACASLESLSSTPGRGPLSLVTHRVDSVPAAAGILIPKLSAPELRDAYRRSKIIAVSTKLNWHVSGMTAVLEAMACGRPVVATATPGIEDYVTDGETGLLVPVGDSVAMAKAIRELLEDHDRREEMGRRARADVLERFTRARMITDIAGFVDQALAR